MRVEGSGPVPCDLMLLGEMPAWDEQIEGRPFVGKSGQQLWSNMKRFTGLTRDDFYVSNVIKDGLPKGKDPKAEHLATAIPEFLDELERVQPRIVITAGSLATRALLGTDVRMADVHGIPHEAEVCGRTYTVLPMYHPGAGLGNKGFLAVLAYDLGRLSELLAGNLAPWAPSPHPARCSWLSRDAMRACERVKAFSVVGCDSEGWADDPRMLSFSPDGVVGYVIRTIDGEALDWFRGWLSKKTIVPAFHNGLYDVPVYRAVDITIGTYHDTQVLGYHDIIRTGSGVLEAESQNLGTLAYRELGMRLGELSKLPGVDLASREIPYTDDVMRYAGEDPVAAWRLFNVYRERGLVGTQAYQIDMGQVGIVEEMITNGIPFDVDATTDFYAEVIDKLENVTADLQQRATRLGNREFNPGSHPQVRELITRKIGLRIRKRTKGGLASTNEKALADHQEHPFVKKLQEHRELVKLRGTYIVPLLEELVN